MWVSWSGWALALLLLRSRRQCPEIISSSDGAEAMARSGQGSKAGEAKAGAAKTCMGKWEIDGDCSLLME